MKNILKKLAMVICTLSLCVCVVASPLNTTIANAATTSTKRIVISSPQVRGVYDAYLVTNGSSKYIGTSSYSWGNITLSKSIPITVNGSASIYILLKYKDVGSGTAKTNTVKIISEQQLKTGFYSIRANIYPDGTTNMYLSVLP